MGSERPDEFETIRRLLTPLATDPAARGLRDDAAVLTPPAGRTLVLTHDTIVAGVHFWPDDPPDLIARKLLRVNLSDLAAKGAEPFGYLMSCAWAERCDWAWRESFVQGLATDQTAFGLALLGGDTVSTPGPLTLGATLIGWGRPGQTPNRSGAGPGDILLVSGTIGDGGLGLMASGDAGTGFASADADWLLDRYRLPRPRLELSDLIATEATASADVSDGLIADIGHIARASGVMIEISLDAVPLSPSAERWLSRQADAATGLLYLAAAGDDYEIALTVRPDRVETVKAAAARLGCPVVEIGHVRAGKGMVVTWNGREQIVTRPGWRHR